MEMTDKGALSEAEVKTLLREKGILTTDFLLPRRGELPSLPLRFPLAVKVCSRDILHKTDVGGVFLDVRTPEELEQRYDDLASRFPGAQVLVESMEPKGPEVIVGLLRDKDFGLSIMFGMGGVMAELYKDVSFRRVPISKLDAEEMLQESRAAAYFEGFRSFKADRVAAMDLLMRVSKWGESEPGMEQLDLNPVILRTSGYVVVDAKMILRAHPS